MTTEGLLVRGLTVDYPGRPPRRVLDGLDLDLAPNSSLGLVGASGSGKSTLLLALVGAIPSEGKVTWNGADLTALPTHRRGIGLVFQDGQLFSHMTVGANIAFGLRARGDSRAQSARRVKEVLSLVRMDGMESRRVNELSGGERQRVALARTLAPEPSVVLLDEPLSALDSELRQAMAADLRASLEAVGATWILVTHDTSEAQDVCDQVLELEAGRLRPWSAKPRGRA